MITQVPRIFTTVSVLILISIPGLGGCSNSSRGDATPPAPGNDGKLAIVSVTDRSVSLSWMAASDNNTAQNELEYCAYYSAVKPINTVRAAKTRGTLYKPCTLDSTSVTIAGLDKNTPYYFNVVVQDRFHNAAAYAGNSVATLRLLPINFTGDTLPTRGYFPAISDINQDGWLESVGTLNRGEGSLQVVFGTGLDALFSSGRVHRDVRFGDLDLDGDDDIIANTYSSLDETDSYAKLLLNDGAGNFTEDPDFSALSIRGFGETILVADFDNDGDLDLFIPYYSFNSPDEHSYLLLNDGKGKFHDIADAAGVALRDRPLGLRPEGAQAVDFNLDGFIDLYVAGHFFINNGNLTFTDMRAAFDLPELFDEGIKFLDWNNDGFLDLVIHDANVGPRLFEFNGIRFHERDVIPPFLYELSFGFNAYDLNGDGLEDLITSGGALNDTVILLNNGSGFERSNPTFMDLWGNDAIALADLNRDGRIDILKRESGQLHVATNQTEIPTNNFIRILVVGRRGEHNQQGRVVKVVPRSHPNVIFTRVVDSGSGYLSQSQYELLVSTPYPGPHDVDVFFANGSVSLSVEPGGSVRVSESGSVERY